MLRFRLAVLQDAAELARLNALFNGEGGSTAAQIADSLSDGQEIVCVAEEGGRLVGFCCGQVFRSMCYPAPWGEITELFVAEGHRRRGVGRELMALVESELGARGADAFKLYTGADNPGARALYRSCGYTEAPERMFQKNRPG